MITTSTLAKKNVRRGYIRSVEAIIAIVMLLASFQAFVNWSSLKTQSTQSIRQSAYDVLSTQAGTNKLVFYDPTLYDDFISAVMPSNLNYRMEVDYFSFLDTFFGYNDTGYPYEVTLDLPPGSQMVSVSSEKSGLQLAQQERSNWFRIPFFIRTRETGFTNGRVVLGLTFPYTDSNSDGLLEAPDVNSLDLYVNGIRQQFILQNYVDTGTVSRAVFAFDYTMNPDTAVEGYAYYMVGGQAEGKRG